MIEAGLATYLKAQAGVSGIVGTRVFPHRKPRGKVSPFIVFQRDDTERVFSLSGHSGLTEATIQLGCWADTYLAAKQLADAVRLVVDGYQGAMGTFDVRRAHIVAENDTADLRPSNKEMEEFGVFMWVEILYCETAPSL